LEEDATFEFGSNEDAPMCLDVHPNVSLLPHFVLFFILHNNRDVQIETSSYHWSQRVRREYKKGYKRQLPCVQGAR
jgi:hypothetical protein